MTGVQTCALPIYGKTVKGGEELVLMVANTGSEAMQDTNPPGYWDTAGWDMK